MLPSPGPDAYRQTGIWSGKFIEVIGRVRPKLKGVGLKSGDRKIGMGFRITPRTPNPSNTPKNTPQVAAVPSSSIALKGFDDFSEIGVFSGFIRIPEREKSVQNTVNSRQAAVKD
ncbi:hypothetical protein [Thiohalophilus sp.]|uniref:hypothetical protein n=1 Tax=Thiohalophilus sp. TaxID=3028392 RepID=UPI002ACE248C|nr:hypothetical protein [Thiohalophilus sp.]MDZ7804180.1 hypothetical protein [Thiohalophilus sp.]